MSMEGSLGKVVVVRGGVVSGVCSGRESLETSGE